MTEAAALALLERGEKRRPTSGGTLSELAQAASAVREARRAGNRVRSGFVAQLRCECARPSCRETFPAAAEAHRGMAERFIVVPAHLDGIVMPADIGGVTVVRAADRFFVLELDGRAGRLLQPIAPRRREET
jgi:hypothetical protein